MVSHLAVALVELMKFRVNDPKSKHYLKPELKAASDLPVFEVTTDPPNSVIWKIFQYECGIQLHCSC